MKRKPFIAISVLALFMFVGCSKKSEMLFKAVYENNVARARRLIEAGADVNANNNFGRGGKRKDALWLDCAPDCGNGECRRHIATAHCLRRGRERKE